MSALQEAPPARDFDGLYRHHAPSVYRYTYAVLGNHADAEDVTQQTFLNAYRACAQGTQPRKAENWLLTIAHNELRRHFRTTGRKPVEVELDEELAGPTAERIDPSLAEVLRALRRLPPAQRSAIVMREFEGRAYAEIAETMGMSRSALEALTFRARRSLALELEEALTCGEAEAAVVRRLDRRLPRRIAHRLKAHLQDCRACVSFDRVQKRQRAALSGLSVLPIPASLFLVRAKEVAAAVLGPTTAAAGGTAAGAGSTGIAASVIAKVAAVTAAATVAGGVGYDVTTGPNRSVSAGRTVKPVAAAAEPRGERPTAAFRRARAGAVEPISARSAAAPASQERRGAKPKRRPIATPDSPESSSANATRSRPRHEKVGPAGRKAHPVTRRPANAKPDSPRSRPAPSGGHGPKSKSTPPTAKAKERRALKPAQPPKAAAQPGPKVPGMPDAKKSPPPDNGNRTGDERKH
jgi:RNA polymerase sigma-70 factor, ECF subfamily